MVWAEASNGVGGRASVRRRRKALRSFMMMSLSVDVASVLLHLLSV